MSERRMRMRVTKRKCRTQYPTVVRRWSWRCEWCGAGARFPGDVRLDVAHDDAWRHGWQCWGWLECVRPRVYVSPLTADEKASA